MSFQPSRRALNIAFPRWANPCWSRWRASSIGPIPVILISMLHVLASTAHRMAPHAKRALPGVLALPLTGSEKDAYSTANAV